MRDDFSVVEAVQRCVGRVRFFTENQALSADDTLTCRFAFIAWGCLLKDLLPTSAEAIRKYNSFLNGTRSINLAALAQLLKAARAHLISQASCAGYGVPITDGLSGFKHHLDGMPYKGIVTAIDEILLGFVNNPTPSTFRPCFQWLSFIERLNLKSLDKTEEYCSQYESFENELKGYTYDQHTLSEIRGIFSEYTKGFSLDHFDPDFGPGAISETIGRRLGGKAKVMLGHGDQLLRYFTSRLPESSIPDDIFADSSNLQLTRTNKIVFVPKSIEKNRIISKEPSALGWYQHGIARALDDMIANCPILRRRVNLHDQAASRDAAWSGSLFGEYATIDLSNASDSVTLTLLKGICSHPVLRRALLCTRSRWAELPNGRHVDLEKFAPMGSAVCFPIETLIFSACCELAIRKKTGRTSQDYDFVVYGDDIVIKTEYLHNLLLILSTLHFSVNEDKSYWGTSELNFREACGEYFLNGESVRPLRLSRGLSLTRQPDKSRRVGIRTSLISLANESYRYGYSCLRSYVLRSLRTYYPHFQGLVFTDDQDFGSPDKIVTWPGGCTNYNLRSRPDLGERRPYFGSCAYNISCTYTYPDKDLIIKHGLSNLDDYSRLYLWWRKRLHAEFRRDGLGQDHEFDRAQVELSDPIRSIEGWKWAYID